MKQYSKIHTIYKRDEQTGELLLGQWSLPEFEYLQDNQWTFTEKVDGTNIRIMVDDGVVRFGGKTDNAMIQATLIDRLREMFLPMEKALLEQFPDGACLYGEGYGARIQKGGGLYRADQSFVLFDVKIGDWWLRRDDVEDLGNQFGLDVVPIIGRGTLHDMIRKVIPGFNSTWGEFPAEGIVARTPVELKTRAGHRIITKLKTKDFARVKRTGLAVGAQPSGASWAERCGSGEGPL